MAAGGNARWRAVRFARGGSIRQPRRGASRDLPLSAGAVFPTSRTLLRACLGVDSLSVKWTEQGEVIRFAFRVLDPDKAKTLNDKKAEPALIDLQAGIQLVVPSLEQVGLLRQTPTGKPEPSLGSLSGWPSPTRGD